MGSIRIDDYVRNSLTDYGREVNTNRQLTLVTDGLKPVYRRVIYSAMKFASRGTVKTATIVGDVIGTTHPHGDTSVADVVSALVKYGIFKGQGNHGIKMIYGEDISPSHQRYTEAAISDQWYDILKDLMPYVPYKEAEIAGNVEPEFLPTPIPMILLFSGLGISYGVNGRYPMFTPQSLFNAMINDDPYLLEAPFGLEIDKDSSELWDLWLYGLGRITYKYGVKQVGLSSGYGTMISGSPEIFKPNLDKAFYEELNKGQVYILDQTSDSNGDYPMVFVGRSPNVRAITLDDIQKVCEQACKYQRMFRLTVTDGKSAYLIPLKDWLQECYQNYLDLIEKYKSDKISKLEFDYRVFYWLPEVTKVLIKHRNYEVDDIVDEVGNIDCDEEVVKAILRKSIGTLKHTDSTEKLKEITKQIEQFKELDAAKYTIDLISNM